MSSKQKIITSVHYSIINKNNGNLVGTGYKNFNGALYNNETRSKILKLQTDYNKSHKIYKMEIAATPTYVVSKNEKLVSRYSPIKKSIRRIFYNKRYK